MVKRSLGRSPSEDLVSMSTAAKMLGVCVSTVEKMARNGILQPVYKNRRGPKHFPVQEVAALAEIRHQKMDLPSVAMIAQRALVIAKANERRLDELFRILGLRRKVLDTNATEVVALYENACKTLSIGRHPTVDELEEWAGVFYGIDETYLRLVGQHTASQEPWKVFLDLANQLSARRAYECFDAVPELRLAHDALEAARRHLRMVAYMFCRETRGVRAANDLFGDQKITDRLLNVMFSA